MPLISVIIPSLNAGQNLTESVKSVVNQSGVKFEIIVIDGGSTDNSIEQLKSHNYIPLHIIVEPDTGIYDAMNKGIEKARGTWVYFLGTDDILAPNILSIVGNLLNESYAIVFGDVQFENGYRMRSYLGNRTWFQNTLHHQSCFYHRSLFKNFQYDSSLRIIADYELNLMIYMKKLPTYYTSTIIAYCKSGGASSNWGLSCIETNRIRGRHLSNRWLQKGLSFLLYLYYAQKRMRGYLFGHKI